MSFEKNFLEHFKETEYKEAETKLILQDVSKRYGDRILFKDLSLTIYKGDKIGLTGENGAGKSTLLKIITGEIESDSGTVSRPKNVQIGYMAQEIREKIDEKEIIRDFILEGRGLVKLKKEITEIETVLASKKISQDNEKKIFKVYGDLLEEYEKREGYTAEYEIENIMKGLNLDKIDLNKKMIDLSGGEKNKIAFAKVLFSKCDLLLLDEPTNHIDKSSTDWLSNYLKICPGAEIIISHNEEFLDPIVNKVLFLDKQTGKAKACRTGYFNFKKLQAEENVRREKILKKTDREIGKLKKFIERFRAGSRSTQAKSREKQLEKIEEQRSVLETRKRREMKIDFQPKRETGHVPLKIKKLTFNYKDAEKEVLKDLEFELTAREKMVIVGPLGAGKSTLLKLINGDLNDYQGQVKFGYNVDKGYYAQEQENLNPNNNLIEEIKTVASKSEQEIRGILGRFLFTGDSVLQEVKTLSPGEKSRLSLAKLLSMEPNLLLLDEPTNHLDMSSKKVIGSVLKNYKGTILVTSHDTEFLKELQPDKILFLPQGKIDYFDEEKLDYIKKLEERKNF